MSEEFVAEARVLYAIGQKDCMRDRALVCVTVCFAKCDASVSIAIGCASQARYQVVGKDRTTQLIEFVRIFADATRCNQGHATGCRVANHRWEWDFFVDAPGTFGPDDLPALASIENRQPDLCRAAFEPVPKPLKAEFTRAQMQGATVCVSRVVKQEHRLPVRLGFLEFFEKQGDLLQLVLQGRSRLSQKQMDVCCTVSTQLSKGLGQLFGVASCIPEWLLLADAAVVTDDDRDLDRAIRRRATCVG